MLPDTHPSAMAAYAQLQWPLHRGAYFYSSASRSTRRTPSAGRASQRPRTTVRRQVQTDPPSRPSRHKSSPLNGCRRPGPDPAPAPGPDGPASRPRPAATGLVPAVPATESEPIAARPCPTYRASRERPKRLARPGPPRSDPPSGPWLALPWSGGQGGGRCQWRRPPRNLLLARPALLFLAFSTSRPRGACATVATRLTMTNTFYSRHSADR